MHNSRTSTSLLTILSSQIDVELQIKSLTLTGSLKAHLTEILVLLGITGNQLRCSRSKRAHGTLEGAGRVYLRHVFFRTGIPSSLGQNVLYKFKNHFKRN